MIEDTARPTEQALYERLWQTEEYRHYAPGEEAALRFLAHAKPRTGSLAADLGCGTGRGGLLLAAAGLDVTFVDFISNALDAETWQEIKAHPQQMRMLLADLTKNLPLVVEFGLCVDVLEHIPPQEVDGVLNRILMACRYVWFQIATGPDQMGALVGHPLHLSVHDAAWWRERFTERECQILHEEEGETHCTFYVSGWSTAQDMIDRSIVNEELEQIRVLPSIDPQGIAYSQVFGPRAANAYVVGRVGAVGSSQRGGPQSSGSGQL